MNRSGERGIAMIIVMFMVLALSLIGSSLMFVSNTETLSSMNYMTVSQVRYAAESGIHTGANQLLWSYAAPGNPGADPADVIGLYNLTTSPVRVVANGNPVVLSSVVAASNYPVAAVETAFSLATQGNLAVGNGTVGYTASATLLSMRQITDGITGLTTTLQTWRITGSGNVNGAGSSNIQVSSILETEDKPVWQYAAFSTNNGCNSLVFGGNAHTDSYTSAGYAGGTPPTQASGGNVGTNGNLDDYGSSSISGSLSTPRSGVGACSANNVTAMASVSNVSGGLVPLSQAVTFPTPADPNPLPLQTSVDSFTKNGGCPANVTAICTAQAGQGATIHPATAATVVMLDNVSIGQNDDLHLGPGIYVVNSISNGGAIIVDGGGPVIIKVAGKGAAAGAPIDLSGGDINNNTYDPSKFEIIYNGTGTVTIGSNADAAALIYAPNAAVSMSGNGDFYGAIIAGTVGSLGTSAIHYDRNLLNKDMTQGSPVLDQFTWSNY